MKGKWALKSQNWSGSVCRALLAKCKTQLTPVTTFCTSRQTQGQVDCHLISRRSLTVKMILHFSVSKNKRVDNLPLSLQRVHKLYKYINMWIIEEISLRAKTKEHLYLGLFCLGTRCQNKEDPLWSEVSHELDIYWSFFCHNIILLNDMRDR